MRSAAVQAAMAARWTLTALLVYGYATEVKRRRRAEVRAQRLTDAGAVDIEPLLVAAEDVVDVLAAAGRLRPSRSEDHRSAVVALAAYPDAL